MPRTIHRQDFSHTAAEIPKNWLIKSWNPRPLKKHDIGESVQVFSAKENINIPHVDDKKRPEAQLNNLFNISDTPNNTRMSGPSIL